MLSTPEGLDLFRLDGRTALVPGGSRGLGKSMARGLASAGANVAIVSRTAATCAEVADEIAKDFGVRAIGVSCDVTEESPVADTVERVVAEFGGLDILVNNAGLNVRGSIEELELADFERVMAVNVRGPWLCARAAAPHLRSSSHGRLINLSSTLGAVALAGRTPYASSKGAVSMMTKVLALEWAGDGVTVNAICPGPFLTEMNLPIADRPEAKQFILGAVSLGRWGELREIQGAALFLASDAGSFVTGSTLFVDGGWTAH